MEAVLPVATLVAAALFALVIITRRTWAQFWLSMEDPRAMALLRIVLAFLAICNVNGLWEYFGFLFSDEGILPAEVARQVFASRQFAGFGDGGASGEPWGFFDLAAFGRFLSGGRISLLYFWDSPTAMWLHLAAFWIAGLCLMVGLFTRASAIATYVLMSSLFDRNPLFWEGTELVFRVFVVYLAFARSGHAWSVDNWLRCRRLQRDGKDEPVYRRIPVWPRRLMMLQLAILYFTTGALKWGSVWAQGDAVYYAMNLDHFYRVPMQPIAAVFGTNVLRVVTWFVRWGEMGFALVFVGAWLRVWQEYRLPDGPRTRWDRVVRWVRTWIFGRRIWLTWALLTMGGIFVTVNIGMFQPIMLALSLVYIRGEELERIVARIRRREPIASELPRNVHRDRARVPGWALWSVVVIGVAAVMLGSSRIGWAAVAFLAGVAVVQALRARGRSKGTFAMAYGPLGRCLLGAGLVWHLSAVVIWLIPEQKGETRKEYEALRKQARDVVRPWLTHTRTTQGWGMFAPNPPRDNVFMQVLVTDDAGEVWDMNSDVYAETRRPIPFVFNDRMRKMSRRIIGGEGSGKGSWYQKWYARWQCRDFALSHDGRVPREVELVRWSYRIPTPEAMAERGWYDPMKQLHEHGVRKVAHTERCANAVLGQPSPEVAARHGVESSVEHRPWIKRRQKRWEQRGDE